MFVAIGILMILLIICFSYLIFYQNELGKITKTLANIQENHTNQEIQINSRNQTLVKLTNSINQQLKRHKKMSQIKQRESREFDQAINNIAHDLRTPLTVANGYNQYLAMHPDLPVAERQAHLSTIIDQQKVAEDKLEELLTYNRLKEQELSVDLAYVNVSQLVEHLLLSYFQAFEQAEIKLTITIAPQVIMISDEGLVRTICQNLVGNLLLHGVRQGEITLLETDTEVILSLSNHMLAPIKETAKLCERFYTEDMSRTTHNSGLGLYITKEIVTLLGGELVLESKDDQFKVIVKLKKQQ